MMKSLLTLILVILSAGMTSAGTGETGFAFLKIGIGGRSAGMGETAIASSTDASAAYWNPAGLIQSNSHDVIFTYNRWIAGIQHNFGAAKFVYGNNAFALHYISTGMDDIEQRDIPSENPTAYFSSHDLALGISYARKMNDRLSLGMTGKYIYEHIQSSVSAFAIDLGAWYDIQYTYDNPDKDRRWRIGLTLTNLGFSDKFVNEKVILPTAIRLGSVYHILPQTASGNTWLVAADIEKPSAENVRTHLGTEYGYKNTYFARAGYQLGYEARGVSAGIGIKIRRVTIDYGYMPFSNSLGATHRISAALAFE